MQGNVSGGIDYLLRGARMLTHPRLRPFVIIPLLVNITIFATLLTLGIGAMSDTLDRWIAAIPEWLQLIYPAPFSREFRSLIGSLNG